jgi:hypothetical protein
LVKAWEALLEKLLCLVKVKLILRVLALEPSYLIFLVRLSHLHVLKTNQVTIRLHIARHEVIGVKIIHVSRLIVLRVNLAHEILELIIVRQTVIVGAIRLLHVINLLTL